MRLVLIEWRDARGGIIAGWRPVSDMRKKSEPSPAVSVGWVVREDEESVVVCPHLVGDAREEGDGEIVIPRDWVTRVVDLVEAKPSRRKS